MSEFYIERNTKGGPPPTALNAADESSPDGGGYSFRFFGGRRPGGQASGNGNEEEGEKEPASFEQPPVELQISPGLIADSEGQTPVFPPPPPDKAVIPPQAIKSVVEQNLHKAEEIVKTEIGGNASPES